MARKPIQEVKANEGRSYSEVIDPKKGTVVRVYTENDHGKDHRELAKSFAGKNGYIVK